MTQRAMISAEQSAANQVGDRPLRFALDNVCIGVAQIGDVFIQDTRPMQGR